MLFCWETRYEVQIKASRCRENMEQRRKPRFFFASVHVKIVIILSAISLLNFLSVRTFAIIIKRSERRKLNYVIVHFRR